MHFRLLKMLLRYARGCEWAIARAVNARPLIVTCPGSVLGHVGFVVGKENRGHISLRVQYFGIPPFSVIQPVFHTHSLPALYSIST